MVKGVETYFIATTEGFKFCRDISKMAQSLFQGAPDLKSPQSLEG
jgi:hypothetical protein